MSTFQKWAMPTKKGLIVRYPRTMAVLPEEGNWVDWIGADGRYWRKTVRQGDVKVFDEPPKKFVEVESRVIENETPRKRKYSKED